MTDVLTATGVKLCMLLGLTHPTYAECQLALMHTQTSLDAFRHEGPSLIESSPDNLWHGRKGYVCVDYAEYDIYDGTKGKAYWCTRNMKIRWVPGTATWMWESDND